MKKRTAMPFYGKFQQMLETEARKAMQANDRETANKFFEGAQASLAAKREAWMDRLAPMREFNAVIKLIGRSGTTRKKHYAPKGDGSPVKPSFWTARG